MLATLFITTACCAYESEKVGKLAAETGRKEGDKQKSCNEFKNKPREEWENTCYCCKMSLVNVSHELHDDTKGTTWNKLLSFSLPSNPLSLFPFFSRTGVIDRNLFCEVSPVFVFLTLTVNILWLEQLICSLEIFVLLSLLASQCERWFFPMGYETKAVHWIAKLREILMTTENIERQSRSLWRTHPGIRNSVGEL